MQNPLNADGSDLITRASDTEFTGLKVAISVQKEMCASLRNMVILSSPRRR
jgi:hypothetical protein